MNIQEISLNIDQKIVQIDKQLASLQQRLKAGIPNENEQSDNEQLRKDVAALERIKTKLQKSRDIMWEAHDLQRGTDQKRLREKRWLGIGLCVVSGLGLVAIFIVMLINN
jgi:hypothetical protein